MKTKLMIAFMGVTSIFLASMLASFPVQRTNTAANVETTVVSENNASSVTITPSVASADEISAAPAAPASSGKSQVTALILALLIGGLGIHRFYLGYTWQGIVQLLTFGGCGIWSLIDLIRIITGDLKPKVGSYTKTL